MKPRRTLPTLSPGAQRIAEWCDRIAAAGFVLILLAIAGGCFGD